LVSVVCSVETIWAKVSLRKFAVEVSAAQMNLDVPQTSMV
jgi:hypothetical protein